MRGEILRSILSIVDENEKGLVRWDKSFSRSKGLVDSRRQSFQSAEMAVGTQPNLCCRVMIARVPRTLLSRVDCGGRIAGGSPD